MGKEILIECLQIFKPKCEKDGSREESYSRAGIYTGKLLKKVVDKPDPLQGKCIKHKYAKNSSKHRNRGNISWRISEIENGPGPELHVAHCSGDIHSDIPDIVLKLSLTNTRGDYLFDYYLLLPIFKELLEKLLSKTRAKRGATDSSLVREEFGVAITPMFSQKLFFWGLVISEVEILKIEFQEMTIFKDNNSGFSALLSVNCGMHLNDQGLRTEGVQMVRARQVTFSRRRRRLFKKAVELSTLCFLCYWQTLPPPGSTSYLLHENIDLT
ncbi:hypothetical protein RND71_023420 [Anisodus tanguticus]|uniref:MADS-box domain-containing protein n=1 Tax=Anisodus tanguticus TaxID=243964 RepID=A0AAE1RUC9_9SOLA|nr:hypothetical protein RND71_023420 [Anisodus tanguticus]